MKSIQNERRTSRSATQTSMLCCLFFVLILTVFLPQNSYGFQSLLSPKTHSTTTTTTTKSRQDLRLGASIVDPVDALAHAQQLGDIPAESLTAIVTTSLFPWPFGPTPNPDAVAWQLIHGISSIPPTAANVAASSTIQEIAPSASEAIQAQAQQAYNGGFNVLDATKMLHGGAAKLPGFHETNSVVAPHLLPGPSDEAVTLQEWPQTIFKARMEYATTMLRAIQKLPYVAFGYALIEFFFLRSDVDLYKEDVEEDPSGVLAETFSDTSVRFVIFFGLAVVTYVIS